MQTHFLYKCFLKYSVKRQRLELMRHLYNEDFSDFESTIKQQENKIESNQGDLSSDLKSINETKVELSVTAADEDQTKSPEDLVQSISTLSGIVLPMESRFV